MWIDIAVNVLINPAGFGMSGAFEEVSDEELRTLMETNFFGVTNVTRAILPTMRKQGSGMIMTVSSQAGAMGFLGSSAYCSSKYAVVGFTEHSVWIWLPLESRLPPSWPVPSERISGTAAR